MSFIIVSLIVFTCVFGGAILGIRLHSVLPNHHLSSESKDIVKLGMGMVGTMSALVLGLLVASAKGSYEAQRAELTQMSANVAVLDRILANYGPETKEMRAVLRNAVARVLDQMWSDEGTGGSRFTPTSAGAEVLYEKIGGLSPQNEAQRALHGYAMRIAIEYRENTLAYVRAVDECGFLAVAGYADLLAHRGFHQFRPLRSF